MIAGHAQHLDVGGDYAFRLRGESHSWTPDTIAKLQHATRANSASMPPLGCSPNTVSAR